MIREVLLSTFLAAIPVAGQACETVEFDNAPFTFCEIDLSETELRLFLRDRQGAILGTFARVEAALGEGERLGVAMNAGMFHDDRSPVGLYIEDGEQEMRIVTSDGPGNFGLLPNGVLCLNDHEADVIESRRFAENPPECQYATQSGPMLVIDGDLHPRFLASGTSLNIRNGVGISADGERLFLAISDEPVNFHHFGRFFRDYLETPNALYFDGRVSRLHAPGIGRSDLGFPVGPIIGVVMDDTVDGAEPAE
ncbi:phosphodiester glycosidase family protein [Maritalea mobilis]|uniref:phosphodiester glycosidase family protein n=1 Tax=Maritalea mobilis TaxID=483324 RepID=UPI001C9530A1|nr:phosphodiester glycosidase family protein [Maritalea mobilis]MBY6203002.1 phosphodiester glycosidase family protein [Maritalea mobilis]